jgi:hypothetical protein
VTREDDGEATAADADGLAGSDEPEPERPDGAHTEVLGRQATVTRSTSTGPLTRVADPPSASGPKTSGSASSGPLTAVRDAPRGSVDATSGGVGLAGPPRTYAPAVAVASTTGVSDEGAPSPWSPAASAADLGATVTAVPQAGAGAVRKARLTVSQVDPWSVMKMSFLLSLAGGIVLVVAVWLLWLLLSNGDVFVSIDRTVGDIAGSGSTISVVEIFSLRRVMGVALMLAVVQVVLVTALATLAAFLYNLAAGLVGGFEVTLSEDA